MTDVLLRHYDDGGDIEFINGRVVGTDGLETAAYLSLYGGNERDAGDQATERLQWWGNLGETQPEREYRSQFQHLVRSLPAIPANLRRLEDAADADLAWFVESRWATFVGSRASIPALNRVRLDVKIEIDGRVFDIAFSQPWGGITAPGSSAALSFDPSNSHWILF